MTGYWVVFCFLVCGELLVGVNAKVDTDKCDGLICENGIVCEKGKCPCETKPGLYGERCEIVNGCVTLKDTCDAISKNCIYDPNSELKATCDCGDDMKFDGTECKACDCGTNGTCSFDEIGQKVCECNKQNEVKNGKCEFCYCGEKGKCAFNGEKKECSCEEGYAEDKDQTGECKECNCGDDTKVKYCLFNKEGKKVCDCVSMYAEHNGICTECECGDTTSIGCAFTDDAKICICTNKNSQKGNVCEVCYCGEKGKCAFFGENKECSCEEGYVEDKDQTGECKADPCFSNTCKNDGVCTVINSTDYLCECKQPFSGKHCERHPCLSNPCLNDGTCIAVENNYGCVCDEPFYGRHCENDPCTPSPCKNEGLCEVVGIDFNCTCKSPYFGKQCEIEIDTTEADTTVSDRITTGPVTTNKTECYCGENSVSCRLNWMGEKLCFCKEGYDQRRGKETCSRICQSNADCYNDGICDRDSSGYFCLCRGTFIGDQCELDVCNSVKFECRSKGAECVRQGTFGVCECPRGKKMSLYNYCEDICTYDTCVYGTCELTGYNFSQYVCNCYEGYYGSRCENALVIHYTPAITILVILASAIVLFSITSIVAGCWVKKLRKKIAENTKQTGQP